jgi:hypothetical protein
LVRVLETQAFPTLTKLAAQVLQVSAAIQLEQLVGVQLVAVLVEHPIVTFDPTVVETNEDPALQPVQTKVVPVKTPALQFGLAVVSTATQALALI